MPEATWFNGEPVAQVPAALRALRYGDGVFRTCLAWQGAVVDLDAQLDRLHRDAARLQLEPPDRGLLAAELTAVAAIATTPGVLKLILSRRAGGHGYRAADDAADRLLLREAAPRYPLSFWQDGVRARAAAFRLAVQPELAGIKHLNRLEQVLASRELDDTVEELVLADASGKLVSGTRTNLFWVRDGRLYTPGLSGSGIEGMMRGRVLREASAIGLEVRVVESGWDVLEGAEEMFFTNSLIGLWPVARYGTRRFDAPGPCSARLQAALAHPRLCP